MCEIFVFTEYPKLSCFFSFTSHNVKRLYSAERLVWTPERFVSIFTQE